MADRKHPGPPFEDTLTGEVEIFEESPTAPSAPTLLPEEMMAGEGVPAIAAPLPEMTADIWQAGIQALVSVSDDTPPVLPSVDEWAEEARLFRDESALSDLPDEQAALLLAAAGAAFRAQDLDAAQGLLDQALGLVPDAPAVLRARARLAEGQGDFESAHDGWARLATVAESPDERTFYAALAAEWTLARLGTLSASARAAIPAGPARALAVAEAALVAGAPDEVATALGEAGGALSGALGAVLLEEAARFCETGGDRARAGALRASAQKLEPGSATAIFGRLRDAARAGERGGAKLHADLADELPASSGLSRAVRRAAAGLARRRGDVALAGTLLAGLPPLTAAAARDRIDFEVDAGAPLDTASLDRLRADAAGGAAAAILTWLEASSQVRRGEPAAAVVLLSRAIEDSPDAVPLGLVAEEIAGSGSEAVDPGLRATALELWLRVDPARRAEAALQLAGVREAIGGEGAALAARAALQTAIEAAPGSSLFWTVAAADARAGRHDDAAATLGYGAETWAASPLSVGLRACAAARLAAVDPRRALGNLAAKEVGAAYGADARARLAARAGDKEALAAALADAAAESDDPERRAFALVRRAMLSEDAAGRARGLVDALAAVPDHPLALPLRLGEEALARGTAAALWQAGEGGGPAALASLYRLTAAFAADLGDDDDDALRFASELVDATPGDRLAHLALVRAAARLDPERRARTIAELPVGPTSDPVVALGVAEALVASGEGARAAVVLRELRGSRFGTEARRTLARLGLEGGQRMPADLLFGAADGTAAVVRAELAETLEAARGGAWAGVISALETGPPQEAIAGPVTLHAAARVAEGRIGGAEATRLDVAALRAAGEAAEGVPLLGLVRLADGDAVAGLGPRAFELCARRFAEAGDGRSLAVVEGEIGRSYEAAGEPERAAESWRAALAADATSLPAALELRREVARRRDVRAAIDATEAEAARLLVPAHRVRALLLAAALAEEAASSGETEGQASAEKQGQTEGEGALAGRSFSAGGRGRALKLLRAALEIDPGHDAAFEQLRALLEEEGDAAGLAAALEARIAVAANPFEVTSLRLARADVLAAKLGDRKGARQELDAILHKQPEHARALARLSELHWEDEAWGEAGEIYLRRAVVEREPRTLLEVFLRLGHIYGERVPDAKRAITAFERVRTLDPDNREALRALSNLYLAEGDTKLALPVTERVVAIEPDAKRRTAFQVRLGELLMRGGDLRRAATELRRAVDAAPRDLGAVTALCQLLERTRDPVGRRALLDHSVGLLRHDVERGDLGPATLRGLASLLALRDCPNAAAAAAQLLVALAGGEGERARDAASVGRSALALRRPELDDRSFPPALPPGVRQIMKLVGPLCRPGGSELAQRLAHHAVTRADRAGRGTPPRPVFDAVAAELGAGEFELYIKAAGPTVGPVPLRVEPGVPAAIILGAPIVTLGPAALRFAAARCARLLGTGLDVLLAVSSEEAAALLVGIIRQFVPEYRHPGVRDALADAETARAARIIPRRLRPQLMPFAVESAGPFDPEGLHAAVRDGANAAGLLASGDLASALSVVLAISGTTATVDQTLTLPAIVSRPEALALVRFAVSDDHDELVRAMESS